MIKKLRNSYQIAKCGWIIGWRCLLINLRSSIGYIDQTQINQFAKRGAAKLFKTLQVKYDITYTCPLLQDGKTRYIFMSNHQSLLDLPLIYASMMGTIRLIAKKELFQIPFFGKVLSISGCIPIDRKNPLAELEFFQQVQGTLTPQTSIWIFPEGTRSRNSELLPFKIGGFRLARECNAKIVPVGISGTRDVLHPDSSTLHTRKSIRLRVGKPIDASEFTAPAMQKQLIEEVRLAIQQLIRAD